MSPKTVPFPGYERCQDSKVLMGRHNFRGTIFLTDIMNTLYNPSPLCYTWMVVLEICDCGSIADKTPGADHKGVKEPKEQADQRWNGCLEGGCELPDLDSM